MKRGIITLLSFIIIIGLLIVYGLFRPPYFEKLYINNLKESHTQITTLYNEIFSDKYESEKENDLLSNFLTASHEINSHLILIGIGNSSNQLNILSQNGIFLKNEDILKEIISDFELGNINKEKEDYIYRYYKNEDKLEKFYFFTTDLNNDSNNEKLVLIFSEIDRNRLYTKMLLETFLIVLGMIILTVFICLIIPKKKIKNISGYKLPVIEDKLYISMIFDTFSNELAGYELEKYELYIRTGSKTFVKYCEFSETEFKICEPSSVAQKILDTETIDALKTFNFMLTDSGKTFSVPLISNSVSGILSVKGKNILTGDNIASLKPLLQRTANLLAKILEKEKLNIHSEAKEETQKSEHFMQTDLKDSSS